MSLETCQAYCGTCRRLTLHVRTVADVPHVLHALVTLFLCGLWLPIWLIHSAMGGASSEPFICQTCGCAPGGGSPFADR